MPEIIHLSYHECDIDWARWMAATLENQGLQVSFRARDISPGHNVVLRLQEVLENASRVIAILSPQYTRDTTVAAEWAAAFARDPDGRLRYLIPVRIVDFALEGLFASLSPIDLFDLDEATATERLTHGLAARPAASSTLPSFPGQGQAGFPGTLPSVWNVPFLRNPYFTGRESEFTELRAAITTKQRVALTQVISGLGGVGKTQIALEYCYRYSADYDVIWWLRAEEQATLTTDIVQLAEAILSTSANVSLEQDRDSLLRMVRTHLQGRGRWLLVFDNATGADDLLPYLPSHSSGHVIITSRNVEWGALARPLVVEVMEKSKAVQFLKDRVGDISEGDAAVLCEAVGSLPLALEHAAAYLVASGRSVTEYVDLLQRRMRDLIASGDKPVNYPSTVWSTWSLSFDRLEEESKIGSELLNICSYLSPDGIPRILLESFLQQLLGCVDEHPDPILVDRTLAAIRRYSLATIRVQTGSLSVHRLVQSVLRDRLEEGGRRRELIHLVLGKVRSLFPGRENSHDLWRQAEELLPSALSISSFAMDCKAGNEATSLMADAAHHLLVTGRYVEAQEWLEKVIGILEAVPQHSKQLLIEAICDLGIVHGQKGDPTLERRYFERALSMMESELNPSDLSLIQPLARLALLVAEAGDFKTARAYLTRTKEFGYLNWELTGPGTWAALTNLGRTYQVLGDYEQALIHLRLSLQHEERAFGSDHPRLATPLSNLGLLLRELHRDTEALEQFQRALTIIEAKAPGAKPLLSTLLGNVGYALEALGRPEEARSYYERSLDLLREICGPKHPELATCLNNLGTVAIAMGDHQAAFEYTSQALKMDEEILGPNHLEVAADVHNLGRVHFIREEYHKAQDCYQRSLQIIEALDDRHPSLVPSLISLAELFEILGNVSEALRYARRALGIVTSNFKLENRLVGDVLLRVGVLTWEVGNPHKARSYLAQASALYEKLSMMDEAGNAHLRLGTLELSLNHPKEALRHFQQSKTLNLAAGNLRNADQMNVLIRRLSYKLRE